MSKDEDFDPSRYATLRLFQHTTVKGTQVGGLVGCGFVLPILALRGYRSGKALDVKLASEALTYSLAGGVAVSSSPRHAAHKSGHLCCLVTLGMAKYVGMDQEGLEDRVYRLHYNASQNRCDRFSAALGLLSAAAAPFVLNRSIHTIAGAFTVGSAVGTLLHVLTARENPTDIQKMTHELKVE